MPTQRTHLLRSRNTLSDLGNRQIGKGCIDPARSSTWVGLPAGANSIRSIAIVETTTTRRPPGFLRAMRLAGNAVARVLLCAACVSGLTGAPRTVVLAAAYLRYPDEDRQQLFDGLRQAAVQLHKAGKQVVFVSATPVMPFPTPLALAILDQQQRQPSEFSLPRDQFEQDAAPIFSFVNDVARQTDGDIIDAAGAVCQESQCFGQTPDGQVLYFDAFHLSLAGARYLVEHERLRERSWMRQDL